MSFIEICKKKDLLKLRIFLKNILGSEHILVKNLKFFNWQYYNKIKKEYNFVIYKEDKKIIGCHVFIPNKHYSKNLSNLYVIWLTNWFTEKDTNCGLQLLLYPVNNFKYSLIGGLGCNSKALEIYKKINFKCGYLKQYFIVNLKKKKFNIIKAPKKYKNFFLFKKNYLNKRIVILQKKLNFNIFKNNKNFLVKKFNKDETFFNNRYLKHPIYKYYLYLIIDNLKPTGLIVIRFCKFKKFKAIRIVDFFGYEESLINISSPLHNLLIKTGAEYVDFYLTGINSKIMEQSGLVVNRNNKFIIPNYFEPFKKKNVKISFVRHSDIIHDNYPIFKGDCDQDRPSI